MWEIWRQLSLAGATQVRSRVRGGVAGEGTKGMAGMQDGESCVG